MKKLVLAVLSTLVVQPAFAEISISCGKGLNKEEGILKTTAFVIASESGNLRGPTGKEWQLYNSKNELVKKATIKEEANRDLTLVIMIDESAHVGVSYTIKDNKDNLFTTAEKKNIGGFAGGVKVDTLDCTVTVD